MAGVLRLRLRPELVDALLALALFIAACSVGQQGYYEWPEFGPAEYVLSALISLPLAVRRRMPFSTFLITSVSYAAYLSLGNQPTFNIFGPILAFYTIAGLDSLKVTAMVSVLLGALMAWSGLIYEELSIWVVIAQTVTVPAIAWAFGDNVRKLQIATEKVREEQRERTLLAVMEERARIARELHDVVAHHMSVISVQAGLAGYVFTSDPSTARSSLDNIASTSREALGELRRLLAVLRPAPHDETFDPAPGLDELPELTERVGADLKITGTPRSLPPGLQLCAYRVIQEALTNALKHAPGAHAQVTVDYRPTALVVNIVNDGPVVHRKLETSGHGLIGLRERARLYQGTVHAGHRLAGGFEVELILPIPEQR